MTSVISLPSSANSLLFYGGSDTAGRSCTSIASARSCGTVQYHRLEYTSTESLSSRDPIQSNSLQRLYRNISPKVASCADLPGYSDLPPATEDDAGTAYSTAYTSASPVPIKVTPASSSPNKLDGLKAKSPKQQSVWDGDASHQQIMRNLDEGLRAGIDQNPDSKASDGSPSFSRWISKLRRRHRISHQVSTTQARSERWALDDFDALAEPISRPNRSLHRKSDSHGSSLGFVHAVKSATETLASVSIATISRRNLRWHPEKRRSSALSGPDLRTSMESQASFVDDVSRQRSYRRRQKLEELISTEEGYLADIKALYSAYSTLLAHHPTRFDFIRTTVKRTLADILQLHDEIVSHLHYIVPSTEYENTATETARSGPRYRHVRWHSIDTVPPRPTRKQAVLAAIRQGRRSLNLSRSSEEDAADAQCSPQTVAVVAEVFTERIRRFNAYEEYGVNYGLLQQDVDEVQQSVPTWQEFDRAIEAISAHINPARSRVTNNKRAMTMKDLLIKPIQRLPRYELLFTDLRNLTPVCDDPEAYTVLTELLTQLNEICRRMNEVKDHPNRARMLQASYLIEDRLIFSSQLPRSVFSQLLGHAQLCGCLYIAYRGKERIRGSYVICVLFQSTLLLARIEDDEQQQKYSTLAGISLATATIEETDNAKGLQCHTAPHAWKVVFEHSARMFELLFVACSAVEADIWRKHISVGIQNQLRAVASGTTNVFELQSPLTAEMRSVGKAFGKPGSFVRRMSVHRTATVGPTTDLNQVIIENTPAVKEVQGGASQHSLSIARSQSVGTTGHVQTLAPRRAERQRLETLLADVWTRDLLPYPRMVRRSDPIRTSANNVIRKFSMASITSNFSSSKRSTSHTSMKSWRKEETPSSRLKRFGNTNHQSCGEVERSSQTNTIDFHSAPEAFLPEDFGILDMSAKRKNPTVPAPPLATTTTTTTTPRIPRRDGSRPGKENVTARLHHIDNPRDDTIRIPVTATAFMPHEKAMPARAETPSRIPIRDRLSTPAPRSNHGMAVHDTEKATKSPRKSKSMHRLFRMFAADHP